MKNIGIDLVEMKTIKKIGVQKIANRILSKLEYQIYNKILSVKRKCHFVAGRWAAKEAIFKVYSKGNLCNNYYDWSILNDEKNGSPYVIDFYNNQVMISITHTDNYALALAILV
ncbi:holo-ACP synthase [Candidatus Phytoplasma melaleucae]|uniref:4'-phosphopantetheinyl transferase superfamily protein n=1 Tax=Candidatus Phytoplasma melaleucae TaxID=2982630 RepID=A0ABT9DCQ9_9MOLU|nr:4'-phosphopantetheinyl transferase superfamily protein ['Melaleuca sp.' phytoplasma]MDO8167895.1 4'-phosphopantetheinyl transferase superfamily protein ['Melaleuca sp.' phytoplasma]MDV3205198.1 4'-phosphopantetheinyl transferase superfamily protein [Weeping tea tree witches'-broom phytoplasma]